MEFTLDEIYRFPATRYQELNRRLYKDKNKYSNLNELRRAFIVNAYNDGDLIEKDEKYITSDDFEDAILTSTSATMLRNATFSPKSVSSPKKVSSPKSVFRYEEGKIYKDKRGQEWEIVLIDESPSRFVEMLKPYWYNRTQKLRFEYSSNAPSFEESIGKNAGAKYD